VDQRPLVTEQFEAGGRLLARLHQILPLRTAFWMLESEEPYPYLYVVPDIFDVSQIAEAYHLVNQVAFDPVDPWLDPFQIKVIAADSPKAKAMIEIQKSYQGRVPVNFFRQQLRGLDVAEAYLYRLPATIVG